MAASTTTSAALPDDYSDCHRVRRDGVALTPADLADARASSPPAWPALCGEVGGWAGISIAMSTHAIAFAADGARVLVCGASSDACDVVDFHRGTSVTATTKSPWPDGLDGTPVTQTPTIKALVAKMNAPAPQGQFPYADDLRLSWTVAAGGSALTFTLLAPAAGIERPLQRFPRGTAPSGQAVVAQPLVLSPDGSVAALSVFTSQGGSGYDVTLVNLHAEAAALFRAIAATGDPDGSWAKKATAAEARAALIHLPSP